jgi:hypothetical protein
LIGTAYSRRKFKPQVRMTVDEAVRETYPLAFRYGESESFCKEATHVFIGKDIRACGIVRQLYDIVPPIIGPNQNRLRATFHLPYVFVGRENGVRTRMKAIFKGTKLNETQLFLQT